MPYSEVYRYTARQALPYGASIRSRFACELSDEAIDASMDAIRNATTPFRLVHFHGLGGAMARVAKHATAVAPRDQPYVFAVFGVWLDPSEDGDVHRVWTESLWGAARHEGSGVYVNFLENEGPERVRDAYPLVTYDRLPVIKRAYDPTSLFRFDQNVKPGA